MRGTEGAATSAVQRRELLDGSTAAEKALGPVDKTSPDRIREGVSD